MRCLAVAALVFAFAQPFIPKSDSIKVGQKQVSIFVDNSFSMSSELENIPLIDIAKQRARDIVNAYSTSDRFQVLTHEFDGRYQRLLSKEDALAVIDEITLSPSVNSISKIINRQKQILKGENQISYLISDFQKSITDFTPTIDTSLEINLLPIQTVVSKNVSIDSVWFDSPVVALNQSNNLIVQLRNHANEEAIGVKTSFIKDGQEKPIGLINIGAGGSAQDTISLTITKAGIQKAEIKILDYPIQFDDSYFVSFKVDEVIKILSIDNGLPNKFLSAAFSNIPGFELDVQNVNQIQYQKLNEYQLIILNDLKSISSGLIAEIKQYTENGGKVLVFPAKDADVATYKSLTTSLGSGDLLKSESTPKEVTYLNTDEFIFNDVFISKKANIKLPKSNFSYLISPNSTGIQETLMSYQDGTFFLIKTRLGKGQFYLCASPLSIDYNDLVANAEIFVPMIFKMAIAKNEADKLAYFIGGNNLIEVENKDKLSNDLVYKIIGVQEFIPSQTNLGAKTIIDIKNQLLSPGFYALKLGENTDRNLAFNYNRKESNLDIFTLNELTDMTASMSNLNIINAEKQMGLGVTINEKDQGVVLWRWFLWAALLFLLMEIILIRLLKN